MTYVPNTTNGNTSVPGLYYHRTIVPLEAQEELIRFFESIQDHELVTPNDTITWERAGIASRKVLHYGYHYPYNRALKLTPTHTIPEISDYLLNPFKIYQV